MPSNSGIARSVSAKRIDSVISSVTHSVTCGALNALRTIASAIVRKTPRTSMRSSRRSARSRCGNGAKTRDSRALDPLVPRLACPLAASPAAASRSARVTTPPGPVGCTDARSIPRSRARLRTGGLANTGPDDSAAGLAATSALTGRDGIGADERRARRVDDDASTPYPTRTASRLAPGTSSSATSRACCTSASLISPPDG